MSVKQNRTRKLTDQDKQRMLELQGQGVAISDIAKELGLGTSQVVGFLSTHKYLNGVASSSVAVDVQPAEPAPAPAASANHPPAPPAPPPAPPPAAPDGFSFNRAAPSPAGGGFNFAGQTTKYQIERVVPPDGFLGVHPAPFTVEDLGKQYGSGAYDVIRQEPGKPPVCARQVIGQSYGEPKYPRSAARSDDRRPWDRHDDEGRPAPQRPAYPYGYSAPYDRDRYAVDAVRQAASIGHDATAEAIRQVGTITGKIMDQNAAERRAGPDGFMRDFLQQQQAQWDRQRQEERDRDEARRRDEEAKHVREMERLEKEAENARLREREQRQTMIELEQKKLENAREEFKLREQALKAEMDRSRQEMKDTREALERRMESVHDSVDEELERSRKVLDREFEIRQKSLDNEHALKLQIIEVQKEATARTEGELVAKTLEKVVGEASKTIRELAELKKFQAMSPEAQAAHVSRASLDGNIRRDEAPAPAAAQPAGHPPSDAARAVPADSNGGLNTMDQLVQKFLGAPVFQEVLKEWCRQVEQGSDATMFSMMYIEWFKDPRIEKAQQRTDCMTFANYMQTRSWEYMYDVLKPHLNDKQLEVLKSPDAERFYETFRWIITEHVKDYCEQFAEQRRLMAEERQKLADQRRPQPAASAKEEPAGHPAGKE